MTLNFKDSLPDMGPETIGRLVGDAEDALTYLREAWKVGKSGGNPAPSMLEAGERFDGVAQAIGMALGIIK